MTNPSPARSVARPDRIRSSEEGYVLLAAIFFLALLVLSLSVAAPQIAKSIQRDRDLETFHRGMQYRRAVQLYYRKFHAYPPNADALVKTNNIRFLRKSYIDPITGQNDWKPIMFGQNKVPTAMGFFGQPLSGDPSTLAGIGPSGGNGLPGSSTGPAGSPFGGSSFSGGSNGGGSIFGSSPSGGDQNSGGGTSGSPSGSTGSTTSGTSSTGGTNSSTSSSTGFGQGQTFGGAGIIGFEPASPKQSILVYKKKNHYNEWEFTYDPLSEMKTVGAGNTGTIGQPVGSPTTPAGGGTGNPPLGSAPTGSTPPSGPNPSPAPMPPDTPAPQ
jgi:type II secretory pathway pseudopilin PulG